MGKEGPMISWYLNCWGPRHGFQYLVEMAMYAGIVTVCLGCSGDRAAM